MQKAPGGALVWNLLTKAAGPRANRVSTTDVSGFRETEFGRQRQGCETLVNLCPIYDRGCP
jgi:hypothetical protein